MKIAFIGHRRIPITENLKRNLYKETERILCAHGDTEFLFGSNSVFDELCLKTVTSLKERYPYLKRIYVRAAFQNINEFYEEYLHELYDETFFPAAIKNAGKAIYIERNKIMIDMCDKLFVYYNPEYKVAQKPFRSTISGTKIAVEYAIKSKKEILNFFYYS